MIGEFFEPEYDRVKELDFGPRYYNATVGHFLSPDPILSAPSSYAYTHGNPVMEYDPSGMQASASAMAYFRANSEEARRERWKYQQDLYQDNSRPSDWMEWGPSDYLQIERLESLEDKGLLPPDAQDYLNDLRGGGLRNHVNDDGYYWVDDPSRCYFKESIQVANAKFVKEYWTSPSGHWEKTPGWSWSSPRGSEGVGTGTCGPYPKEPGLEEADWSNPALLLTGPIAARSATTVGKILPSSIIRWVNQGRYWRFGVGKAPGGYKSLRLAGEWVEWAIEKLPWLEQLSVDGKHIDFWKWPK